MLLRSFLLCCVIASAACDDDVSTYVLTVDLRTDLRPGIEFVTVRTEVQPMGLREVVSASADQDFRGGVRVATRAGLAPRVFLVEVALLDDASAVVASRRVRVTLARDFDLLVVIASDCVGLACPAPGGDPEATECLAGRCVPPTCVAPADPGCGGVECEADADCTTTVACVTGSCVDGICLGVAEDDACASDEYCSPALGCVPRARAPMDGGAIDAGRADAGRADAGRRDGGRPCVCVDAAAECTEDRETCFLAIDCPLSACPSDHACMSGPTGAGRCECTDPVACGVRCSTDDDCASGFDCDPLNNVCRVHRRCADALGCGAGQFCDRDQDCQPVGTLAEGATCASDSDCASGYCESRLCLTRCTRNDECSGTLVCEGTTTSRCVGATGCGGGCGADELCASGACRAGCRRTGDCASGDCTTDEGDRGPWTCSAGPARCMATEWLVPEPSTSFCLRHVPCWDDAHCAGEAGTTCIWEDDLRLLRRRDGSGFCGRVAP